MVKRILRQDGAGAVVGAAMLFASVAVPVTAQTIVREGADSVTVEADRVPLMQMLRALQALRPIEMRVDPRVEARPVTLRLEHVTIAFAIRQTLVEAGVDFVALGLDREPAHPLRLIVADMHQTGLPTILDVNDTAGLMTPTDSPGPVDLHLKEPVDLAESNQTTGLEAPLSADAVAFQQRQSQALQSLIATPPGRPGVGAGVLMPFPRPDGTAAVVTSAPRTAAPFPDEQGRVFDIALPQRSGLVELPFPGPDGLPILVPVAPPPSGRPPGPIGPGQKPPQ